MGAKLYFYYSAMNAGKSATLLQSSYNYNERGMQTMLFIPTLIGKSQIISRIGLKADAVTFGPDFDFFEHLKEHQAKATAAKAAAEPETSDQPCGCVLVDEAQFLKREQVFQLCKICDELSIPVLCYGLRSDFMAEPFEGSKYLLGLCDVLTEIKTICHCGRKATLNCRLNGDGSVVAHGAQVQIGGNDSYVGMCRMHFMKAVDEARARDGMQSTDVKTVGASETTPEKTRARDAAPLDAQEKKDGAKKPRLLEHRPSAEERWCQSL